MSQNRSIFPDEIWLMIASLLAKDEIFNAKRVCKDWHRVFSDDLIWKERIIKRI